MYNSIIVILSKWNENSDDRQKMQHSYVAGAIFMLVVAGLVGLINYSAGQALLAIAVAAIVLFFVNGIVWAVLNSYVLPRLDEPTIEVSIVQKPRRTTRKK